VSEKKRYKIVYERVGCIGAAVCAALDEKHCSMNADSFADLVEGTKEPDGKWTRVVELDEEGKKRLLEAAEGCPVTVIHVIDMESGKQLV